VSPHSFQPVLPQMTGYSRIESAKCVRQWESPNDRPRVIWSVRGAACIAMLSGCVRMAVGQESGGGGVRVETSSRSFTVEALVVVVFMGLALFSVCRSSRRV
jgi:hypothetical protein